MTRQPVVRVGAGLMALVLAAALAMPAASAAPRDRERPAREAAPAASPDRAAARARQLTGGRVLGVQGRGPVYRVRVLEAGGRVRTIDIDTRNGASAE